MPTEPNPSAKRPARNGGRFTKGNRAAVKSGAYGYLLSGKLPANSGGDRLALRKLAAQLEADVVAAGLKLTPDRRFAIGRACDYEAQRRCFRRYLAERLNAETLSPLQLVRLNESISKVVEARDRAVASLLSRNLLDQTTTPAPTPGQEDWSFPIPQFDEDDQ